MLIQVSSTLGLVPLVLKTKREESGNKTVPRIAAAASEQDLTMIGGTTTRKGETAMSKAPRADKASSSAGHQKPCIRSDRSAQERRGGRKAGARAGHGARESLAGGAAQAARAATSGRDSLLPRDQRSCRWSKSASARGRAEAGRGRTVFGAGGGPRPAPAVRAVPSLSAVIS